MLLGRSRIRLTLAVVLLGSVLAALAAALAHNHAAERDSARRRAADEATITAALAATLFGNNINATRATLASTFGDAAVAPASLRNTLKTNGDQARYALVLDAHGETLSQTSRTPVDLGLRPQPAYLRRVLDGGADYGVSSIMAGNTVEFAIRFPTPRGVRVLIEGFDAASFSDLLRAYLGRLPDARHQRGYVVDRNDRVVASLMSDARLGDRADPGGHDRTVVSAPIRGTEWRVVLSQSNARLYQGISATLSWLALAALALAGLAAIAFLVRAQRRGAALEAAYREQRHAALHDGLTGLANRALFHDRVEQAARRTARRGTLAAVLFLDLDHFKVVNDSLGHLHGDEMLIEVSARIIASVRPEDTVARLGGDEFTVLVEDLADTAEAERIAARVLEGLQEPIGERGIYLSASIGIARVVDQATAEEVIRDADAAMYRAKADGRGRHALFDSTLRDAAVERLQVETRLRRHPTAEAGLHVVYQPIVGISDRRLRGFEVLARWEDEDGAMTPDAFIPVAEETGLITALGRRVLQEACSQLAAWRAHPGGAAIVVSVNIAARQLLEPSFEADVRTALDAHDLDPDALRLEITETATDADATAVRTALVALYEHTGVRAHLDDFGTGTASMTVLQRFPGDALKIDRSFVAAMERDPGALQIVTSVIGLAHSMGMAVVAEGIEEASQLETLRRLDCDFCQGFLVARPMSAAAAEAWLDGEPVAVAG